MTNKNDFKEFLHSSEKETLSPSNELSRKILSQVRKDLIPSKPIVFGKLLLVQAFIGVITMLFCPQFSMSLTNHDQLYHFFHRTFGHYGCMMICGSLFIGSGALFSTTILNLAEIRLIKSSKFLSYLVLSGTFVMTFMLIGAEIYLDIALVWIFGATLSGSVFFQVSSILKRKILGIS